MNSEIISAAEVIDALVGGFEVLMIDIKPKLINLVFRVHL